MLPGTLRRSTSDRILAGVCGGLAEYLGWDTTIVRVIFVIASFPSMGTALLIYLLLAFVLPEE